MDAYVDHYAVLGLLSGEEGGRLSEKEISKAYRLKALELHPDKRPEDPNAHIQFQKPKASYEILKDPKARRLFDDYVRIKRDNLQWERQRDSTLSDPRTKLREDMDMAEIRATIFFGGPGLFRERSLRVSWRAGENHTVESLKVLLGKFGEVESVTITNFQYGNKYAALVIMASKDAAAAAASWEFEELKNPSSVRARSAAPPIFRCARN